MASTREVLAWKGTLQALPLVLLRYTLPLKTGLHPRHQPQLQIRVSEFENRKNDVRSTCRMVYRKSLTSCFDTGACSWYIVPADRPAEWLGVDE